MQADHDGLTHRSAFLRFQPVEGSQDLLPVGGGPLHCECRFGERDDADSGGEWLIFDEIACSLLRHCESRGLHVVGPHAVGHVYRENDHALYRLD